MRLRGKWPKRRRFERKVDEDGTRWIKVYFGGGTHFKNWLSQSVELKGAGNVKVEEIDSTGFECYEKSGEKMYGVWVKDTAAHLKTVDAVQIATAPNEKAPVASTSNGGLCFNQQCRE